MPTRNLADLIERIRIVCTVYDPKSGRYRFKVSVIGEIASFGVVTIAVFGFVWHERRRRRRLERHGSGVTESVRR